MSFGLMRVRFCPSASLGVSVFGQGPKEAETLAKLHEKEARVTDEHHAFATAMQDYRMDNDPREVAEFYTTRRGIENSMRADAVQNGQPRPPRPAPADPDTAHILQPADTGPPHGSPPRGQAQRSWPPGAVHAGPVHGGSVKATDERLAGRGGLPPD